MQKVKSNIHYPHWSNLLCIADSSCISKPVTFICASTYQMFPVYMPTYYVNRSVFLNIYLNENNLHISIAYWTQYNMSKKNNKQKQCTYSNLSGHDFSFGTVVLVVFWFGIYSKPIPKSLKPHFFHRWVLHLALY